MTFQINTNRKYGYVFILICIALFSESCNKKIMTLFDSKLKSSVTERYHSTLRLIKNDSIIGEYAFRGDALIGYKTCTVDSLIISEEVLPNVIVFKDGNSVILRVYPFLGGVIEYRIHKKYYTDQIRYWDSLRNYGDHGININVAKSILILKNNSFQIGDTILGRIKLNTKMYHRNKQLQFDTYEGYFTSIVFHKDSINKSPAFRDMPKARSR